MSHKRGDLGSNLQHPHRGSIPCNPSTSNQRQEDPGVHLQPGLPTQWSPGSENLSQKVKGTIIAQDAQCQPLTSTGAHTCTPRNTHSLKRHWRYNQGCLWELANLSQQQLCSTLPIPYSLPSLRSPPAFLPHVSCWASILGEEGVLLALAVGSAVLTEFVCH